VAHLAVSGLELAQCHLVDRAFTRSAGVYFGIVTGKNQHATGQLLEERRLVNAFEESMRVNVVAAYVTRP